MWVTWRSSLYIFIGHRGWGIFDWTGQRPEFPFIYAAATVSILDCDTLFISNLWSNYLELGAKYIFPKSPRNVPDCSLGSVPSGVKRRMNGVLPLADLFLLGNIEIIPRIPIQRWGLVVYRQKVIK